VHIGSQIVALGHSEGAATIGGHVSELRGAGIPLEYLDFGGGLGVRYTNEEVRRAKRVRADGCASDSPLALASFAEPGRTIIGPAGVLLTRVLYVRRSRQEVRGGDRR